MLRFRVFHFRIVGVSFLPVFSDCENLGQSGQRETQRGLCSGAHGKRAAPIGYKLSRGKAFLRPVFGTATPSTGTSETSPRGEGDNYRHFGTATLPRDASVASSRSNCELVFRIVAELGFVKFTWHEPLLIIK